ncbi:MAG: hypothetical protein JW944_01400, partial [Deltaproteobacteria bacterium]|nr:hypothetical protein [Deltaproteobacteria bacterium]
MKPLLSMIKRTFIILVIFTAMAFVFPSMSSARYDPSLSWYTVSTQNFTIYYPEGHELVAQRVLSLSKEVYKDVTGYLMVQPRT